MFVIVLPAGLASEIVHASCKRKIARRPQHGSLKL